MGLLTGFRNLKVGTKLGVGFGSVMLLALGLAVLGIGSQGQIRDRVAKTDGVNSLVVVLEKARIAGQKYLVDQEPVHAEEVTRQIETLTRRGGEIKALFDDQYNRDEMERIVAAAREFRGAFEDYVDVTARGDEAEKVMGDVADGVLEQIEAVAGEQQRQAREMLDAGTGGAALRNKINKVDDANRLQEWMLRARRSEKNFMLRHEPEYADAVEQRLDRMVALVRDLKTRYDIASHRDAADAVIDGLERYRDAFRDFVRVAAEGDRAAAAMAESSDAALEVADKTWNDQKRKMADEIAAARTLLVTVAVLALVLGSLAAWLIARAITGPLRTAVRSIERIAGGDLTTEIKVEGRDETAQVMAAVDRMTRALRDTILRVKQGTDQLASAASELSAVTDEASEGTNQQMAETEQVATAMNEMAVTVSEVAHHASDTASATEEGRKTVKSGRDVVLEAVAGIRTLADDVGSSAKNISALRQRTVEIGTVIDVIRGVAEQTNLLALNAAIEAARAGEQGRGFAVVADEVRTLAQRTQESTSEIEQIVLALQSGADDAAHAMEASTARSDTTVEQADEAGRALEAIDQLVQRINDMTTQIAQAAEEQSSTAELINESINNITQIAERNASGGTQTAAASTELAQLGEQLRGEVARFVV